MSGELVAGSAIGIVGAFVALWQTLRASSATARADAAELALTSRADDLATCRGQVLAAAKLLDDQATRHAAEVAIVQHALDVANGRPRTVAEEQARAEEPGVLK